MRSKKVSYICRVNNDKQLKNRYYEKLKKLRNNNFSRINICNFGSTTFNSSNHIQSINHFKHYILIMIDEKLDLDIYKVQKGDFMVAEIEVFVDSIMSQKISEKYIHKCIVAIAAFIELSEEEFMDGFVGEDGEPDEMPTNDFFEFIEISLHCLTVQKDVRSWIKSFRNLLLEMENYELLNILKLEEKWKI